MGKGVFFRKSLILILIISSIPGIIVGGLIYWMGGGWLENELLQLHKNQIIQRAANIDDQFSYMETSLAHWAFDPKFNSSLTETNFFRDFEVARDITKTLGVMQGSNPLAKQVELYLNAPKPLRFGPEYDVITNADTVQTYTQLLSQSKLAFWAKLAANPSVPEKKDLTLVHKIPGADLHPFGALLVRLNEEKVSGMLKTLTPYNVGETFLMQDDGEVLLSSSGSASQPAASFDETLRGEVLKRGQKTGSFLLDWNRSTYTVSYGNFVRIGTEWTYVSASPISVITKPVDFISKLILSVSCAALLLAVVLSWLASRKIYSPIDRLVTILTGDKLFAGGSAETNDEFKMIEKEWLHLSRESHTLQTKLEEQLPHVKEGFLLQLVQGFLYSYSEEDLLERMRALGWEVDGRQFLVMHVHLTGFTNLEGRFSQGDEGLVTFAAANIIEELSRSRMKQADVMNFHDLSIGLLIMLPANQPYKAELHALSDELAQAINRMLRLQVSVTIGKPSASISQVPSHYEEAKQALGYRNFENENQIIDLDSILTAEEIGEQRYPFALEREIIQAIRNRAAAGSAVPYRVVSRSAAGAGREGDRRAAGHAAAAGQYPACDPPSGNGSRPRLRHRQFVRAADSDPRAEENARLVRQQARTAFHSGAGRTLGCAAQARG
ncbi:AraC family transcriptional regulator [Paenibacillus sp. TAB 01]|uniref:PDC sensor domain-containing protein n=1 Tax=Paenibacillus sp. TAB 01 TaxID=3368988 RepID=UPI0037515AD6